MKAAYVDSNGSLIDAMTGNSLGKVGKNGNFVPYSANEGWSVSAPENGTCLIRDETVTVKAKVHETYKNIGACAIHCLTHHMKHGEVMDEKKMESAQYVCSIHPDVVSDKPGKWLGRGLEITNSS